MGNYVSCTISSAGKQQCRGTKVILPGGEVRKVYEPTKAAELMLEKPSFFLVNARSLQVGRRFSALNADEDLETANVYAMFPMKRLNSLVTAGDMGSLFLAVKRVSGRKFRALPETTGSAMDPENAEGGRRLEAGPKLKLDDVEELSVPAFRDRMSMCRSRKPLLETIAEEAVFSR